MLLIWLQLGVLQTSQYKNDPILNKYTHINMKFKVTLTWKKNSI